MIPDDKASIKLTTDTNLMARCAQMMIQTDPWITLGYSYDQCLAAFDGNGKEIYCMEATGELVGFAILQLTGTFKGYIQTICIQEAHRGKGFGKKLLHFCEERIFKISPNVFICVSSFNKGAIRLYGELGFKRVGELENFIKPGFTELLLRKTIGPITGYAGHATGPDHD